MSNENFDRSKYDVISVSRKGSEKKTNYIKDGYHIEGSEKSSGQFVRVFSDIILKHTGRKSYF